MVGTGRLVSLDGLPDFFHRAFVWTEQTGLQDLGDLPILVCCADYEAVDVSRNGDFIIGNVTINGITVSQEPFLWTEEDGMRFLTSVLAEDYGLSDLGGWDLGTVSAISDDGTAIVGNGINPDGVEEGWRIRLQRSTDPFSGVSGSAGLSPVPEPTSGAVVCLIWFLFAGIRAATRHDAA